MKYYSHDEVLDQCIGEKGTVPRTAYDARMQAFQIGEAIRTIRLAKNMTQEDLGRLMGIQAARISKIEHGQNLTLNTAIRAFSALEVPVSLDIAGTVKVELC